MKEGFSYKFGYFAGSLITKVVIGFAKLIFAGTITASTYCKPLPFVYLSLFVLAILSYAMLGDYSVVLIILMIVATVAGLWVREKERPMREQKKYFNTVFEEINLKANDNSLPLFVQEETLSVYATMFVFQSLIPVAVWRSKKELMEVYFNKKILAIVQDRQNNRNVQVIIETKQLHDEYEWKEAFVLSGPQDDDNLYFGISQYSDAFMNLKKHAHCFVAGPTGCGKSNILKCLIYQSLCKGHDVNLIDFKRGVSFSCFSDLIKVYYEYDATKNMLENLVDETKHRLDLFREAHVDNLTDYNRVSNANLKHLIVFIDELAELLKTRDRELSNSLYDSIETLARISRSAGVHLIMGIQRPDSTVVNGQIKNNVSLRLCGRFVDKEPSRIMLGNDAATHLLNIKGRFILKDNDLIEVQCFHFPDAYAYALVDEKSKTTRKSNDSKIDKIYNDLTIETQKQNEVNFDFSDIQ